MADMTLDLAGYFERIGYRGAADPTLEVLQDLATAHYRHLLKSFYSSYRIASERDASYDPRRF
jgi:hypothetical protein